MRYRVQAAKVYGFPQTFILELPRAGFEPARVTSLRPERSVSANFTISAELYHFQLIFVRTNQSSIFSKRALGEVITASVTPCTRSEII